MDRQENTANADEQSNSVTRAKGGIKTLPCILANDMCEKLAMVGFVKNMVNYFTDQLHMPITKAANTVTNFNGTQSLTPLVGAFIADSYAGKFLTIAVATIIYILGMSILTLSAAMPRLRPPPCGGNQVCKEADGGQETILYVSLILAAIGAGGIKPCVAPFGADQFIDEDPRKQSNKTSVYFNWYYFTMEASGLIAVTVLVYVQDNIGWGWGLGIPTILMALSIIPFVIGYPLYRNLAPAGSPYMRLLQVAIAAFKKRKASMVSDPRLLYVNEELDASISADGSLHHTKQLRFLDKAAIVTEEDIIKSSNKPNLWKLNTVHRVEELKCVIRLLPIWAVGILFSTASVQQNTFSIQQGKTMDRNLTKSFKIPSASMSIFTTLFNLFTIAVYDRLFVPLARKYTGHHQGINQLHRMAIGLFLAILATLIAGFVEMNRKHAALTNSKHPLSIFWLVPQYSLHGISEGFHSVARVQFFYDQAPESMRSTCSALFWTAIAAGNYMSTLLVSLVHKYSAGADGSNWLPNKNLNKGKLENFYWLLTILQLLNFVYFLLCTKFYTFKTLGSEKIEHEELREEAVELGIVS
ncbi:hypothetical protein SLA2020_482840 [Shorea laevis]